MRSPDLGPHLGGRVPGLDVARALAIALVLLSHGRHCLEFLPVRHWDWWWLSVGGFWGVELFFVLSGLLIGDILLREVWLAERLSVERVGRFLLRRWWRTLPLYYAVLLVHGAARWPAGEPVDPRHFFFLQNFHAPSLEFFDVSWSLSVEEWFYAVVPLAGCAVVGGLGAARTPAQTSRWLMGFVLGVAALAVGGRWGWVAKHPDALWTFVRKGVFIRFDAFAVGLFLALAPKVWPTLARTLAGKRAAMAGLFLTGALGGVYWVEREAGLGEGLFGRVALLFFAPAAMSTSLLFLGRAVTRRRPWVETLSRSSYALYLVHTLFFWPLSQWAWAHPDWSHGVAAWSGAMLGSLGCALAVHRWVEQPLLRWRDRRLPPAYSAGRRALAPGERAYSTLNTTAEGSLR